MPKILIADDTESVLKMLAIRLGKIGYETLGVRDGRAVLELLRHGEHPDVMLLDQMMPEMEGLEVFEEVRKINPGLPVIMMTAHGSIPLAVKFIEQGGFAFLEKPLDMDLLKVKIKRAIEHEAVKRETLDLRAQARAAEEANRLKSAFLANISHEIRTPMQAIVSFTRFAEEDLQMGKLKQVSESHAEVLHNADRLMRLLNDILELAKLEAGRLDYDMQPHGLLGAVRETVDCIRALADDKKIRLELHAEGDPVIQMDKGRIGQVIGNLLANAIKFTPTAGNVAVILRRAWGDSVELVVCDSGPGVPVHELELIFDKFYQSGRRACHAGGTGLGLAISREIIKFHKGHIWAENRPEGGASFHVRLPIEQPAQAYGEEAA